MMSWVKTVATTFLVSLVSAQVALAAGLPSQKCEAAKDKASGKAVSCRLTAYGKAENLDALGLALDTCGYKQEGAFAKSDDKYPSDCPTLNDAAAVDAFLADHTRQLAAFLSDSTAELSCQSPAVTPTVFAEGGARTCFQGRLKAAGKDAACRMGAQAKYAKDGDSAKRDAALAICTAKLAGAFEKLLATYADECPANGDSELVADSIAEQANSLAAYLGGSGLMPQCKVFTPTPTPTSIPTQTPTATPTNTPTAQPTDTPTETPTEIPTEPPTNTPTHTPTDTQSPTDTPTAVPTNTPTETPTAGLCGNGSIDLGEDCDGSNVNGKYCRDVLGITMAGAVTCNADCTFNTSACVAAQAPTFTVLQNGNPVQQNPSTTINNRNVTTFTASISNPAAINADQLEYHWVLIATNFPDGLTDRGITGYRQQSLVISPNSMVSGQGTYDFLLTVTDGVTGLKSTADTLALVSSTTLTLDVFNSCQDQTVACPTCQCTNEAALPTNEPT